MAKQPSPAAFSTRAVNPFSVTLTAGCASLVAAGAIPTHDVAFSLAWPAYIAAINKLRFHSNAAQQGKPMAALVPEAWVRRYAAAAGVLALLIPAVPCLCNRSNATVLATLGPHLYLTAAQVVCESVTSGPSVAMLPRMLVPIGFNTYRMGTLWVWCSAAVAAGLGPWHVGLAVANLLFWAYNLFVFLLLKMLPVYLDPSKCAV